MIRPTVLVAAAFLAASLALPGSAAAESTSVPTSAGAQPFAGPAQPAVATESSFASKRLAYAAGYKQGKADAKHCLQYNNAPRTRTLAKYWKAGYDAGYWNHYEQFCLS